MNNSMQESNMLEYIRQSNLIENIDDPMEDTRSLRAWKWLEKQPYIGISDLLELHRKITCGQLPANEAGNFRRVFVRVGHYVAPSPEIAKYKATDWLYSLIEHWQTLDPKEMHVRFEKIHPFIDGNGRTGRMLLWYHEIKLGQKPTLINYEDRQDYYSWFK